MHTAVFHLHRFTAEEVIGYIRVCRPGSVIGPQQGFIRDIQRIMWLEGDAYRAKNGPNPPPLMWGITPAAASIAAATAAAAAAKTTSSSSSVGSSCTSCSGGCGSVCNPVTSSVSISLLVDATGRGNNSSGDGSAGTPSAAAATAAGRLATFTHSPVGPATPSLDKTMSDLSLKQMREHLTTTPTSSSVQRLTRSVSSNSGSGSSSRAVRGGLAPQQLFTHSHSHSSGSSSNGSSGTGPLTSGLICRPSTSQSLLMRYSPATTATVGNTYPAASGLNAYRGTSTRSAQQNKGLSSSMSSSSAAREATLGALLNGSIASLRATLHTDKVTAANRPKVQPQGVVSQSSDFIEAGWRSPVGGSGSSGGGSIGSLGSGTTPSTGVARVLAPNGQPRKVPVAALAAMMPPPAAAVTTASKLQAPGTPQQHGSSNVGRLAAYYNSN